MKIVHVTGTLDPAAGGPPMVVTRLAAAQARLGHEVSVLAYERPGRCGQVGAELRGVPGIGRVEVVRLTPPRGLKRLFAVEAGAAVAGCILGAGMLHMHGVWESLLLIAARVARGHNVPYAVAPHGMLDPWSLRQKRLKKVVALALVYRRMLKGSAFLHVLNAMEGELIDGLNLRLKHEVIPNGVYLEEIDQARVVPEGGRVRWPFQGRPYVLFLGRLHMKKGIDFLVNAYQRVLEHSPAVRLVIAGPDGGQLDRIKEEIASLGIDGGVHLVGPVYGLDKYRLLRDAVCFCLPSRQEGFSVAVLEAMACGVPVVISDQCHFPEVQAEGAGIVCPLDSGAIAEALIRVVTDDGVRARMSQAARAMVEERYTWGRIAERSVEVYRKYTAGGES